MKLKGQRRGASGGNCIDMVTGESFWVSGVKKNGQDRHRAGSGKILVEAAAVPEYLDTIKRAALPASHYETTECIIQTDTGRLSTLANTLGRGWPDESSPGLYSFRRNVTRSANNPRASQSDHEATSQ